MAVVAALSMQEPRVEPGVPVTQSSEEDALNQKIADCESAEQLDFVEEDVEIDEILYVPPVPSYAIKDIDKKKQWNEFLNTHKQDDRWCLKLAGYSHNVSNKKFDKKNLQKISFKNEYTKDSQKRVNPHLTKLHGLIDQLDILWTLGNPLLKEAEGGLKLLDIFTYIKNSGLVEDQKKKANPPLFFKNPDSGRNTSAALTRLWAIVNDCK